MAELTRQETISLIADRSIIMDAELAPIFEVVQRQHNPTREDKLAAIADIEFAHDAIPLDLDRLLNFDDGSFCHDMFGIRRCMNRDTKKFDGWFSPRCALRE